MSVEKLAQEFLDKKYSDDGVFTDRSPYEKLPEFDPEGISATANSSTITKMRELFKEDRGELKKSLLESMNKFLVDTDGYSDVPIEDIPDDVIDELMEFVNE